SRQSRYGRAVRAAHPYADDVAAVVADGPGVAVAVGGAGLVGQRLPGTSRWRWRAQQHVGHQPGRPGIEKLSCRIGKLARHPMQRQRQAAPGNSAIKAHQLVQTEPDAPETDGQPGGFRAWQPGCHSSAAEARDQAGRTEGIEQPYRRYVERQLQGLAQRHRSLMGGFEVAWSVTGKARRAVLDQGFRMGDARFEG